ncbi:MAG TPA: phosphatase PAP2 family protein, partial [Gemmatimonadaceae bacterium]|nr:phosphatase PAP2 family protein [Gemmatimonadaceae bacterium]
MPQEGVTVGFAARRRALVWIGAYVAASGVVLVVGREAYLAVVHLLLLALIAWSGSSERAIGRFIGDAAPLVIAVALYPEIPRLIAVLGTSYHDLAIQHLEQLVFGMQPARTFARAVPVPWLSEVLHAGYMLFYPLIFVPPLLLYVRGERHAFAETIYALTVTWIVCWTCFVLFPVEGPRYLWGTPTGVPDGPIRRLADGIVAAGSSRGAAFPSSHMAVSVVQTIVALRWQRRVGVVCAVVTVLVGFGAVYDGFHYGTDMVAGAVVGA